MEALDNSVHREAQSSARTIVSIVRASTRSLDQDNLVGSVKSLLDCLRLARLIRDDTTEAIELHVSQVKVKTRKEQGTLVQIEYPDL